MHFICIRRASYRSELNNRKRLNYSGFSGCLLSWELRAPPAFCRPSCFERHVRVVSYEHRQEEEVDAGTLKVSRDFLFVSFRRSMKRVFAVVYEGKFRGKPEVMKFFIGRSAALAWEYQKMILLEGETPVNFGL